MHFSLAHNMCCKPSTHLNIFWQLWDTGGFRSNIKGRTSGHHPLLLLPKYDIDQRHRVKQVRLPRAAVECLRAGQHTCQSRTSHLLRCLPW